MTAYCVESFATDERGLTRARFRFITPSKARALEVAAQAPDRTWRELQDDEIPREARENIERAAREQPELTQ